MAEIKMSYIFLEKEKHDSKSLQEILLDVINDSIEFRYERIFSVEGIDVSYRIIQKQNSKRCFLELSAKERVNKSILALQKIDTAFFKSNQQKYYHCIRDYDGISESFCKRLYPKYAEFERNLRSLVLFILTEAYGSDWMIETISEEQLHALQKNAHGKVSLNEVLENMDLAMLESYLFDKRQVDYLNIISEMLSTKCLEGLEKDEICAIIEDMRPTSLWERHFKKFGTQEFWMEKILEVHKTRNKVAHQKNISTEEFTTIKKKLNLVNRDLIKASEGIREENFTEYSSVDILRSFAEMATKLTKSIIESSAFRDVMKGFNAKIQEMTRHIAVAYKNELTGALTSLGQVSKDYSLRMVQSELSDSLNIVGKSLEAARIAADTVPNSKAISSNIVSSSLLKNSNRAISNIQRSSINTSGRNCSLVAVYNGQIENYDENGTDVGDSE